MHALCNKKQSITFTGHLKYALSMTFVVQTQIDIAFNDGQSEFDGFEPLTVGLTLRVDMDFGKSGAPSAFFVRQDS